MLTSVCVLPSVGAPPGVQTALQNLLKCDEVCMINSKVNETRPSWNLIQIPILFARKRMYVQFIMAA